jgi:hypothetical protein
MADLYFYSTNVLEKLKVDDYELGCDRYFGLELEYSFIPDLHGSVPEPHNAIFKEDSSIGYKGAELVSAPMLLQEFPNFLKQFDMREWIADDRCGMHLHINGCHLTSRQIRLITSLIESDECYSFIREIAGRDFASSAFCRKSKDATEGSRYRAVNISSKATVEIRIFAGSSNKEEILQRIQWVNDLIEYTASKEASSDYLKFMVWRGDLTRKQYKQIVKMIEQTEKQKQKRLERELRQKRRKEKWSELVEFLYNVGPFLSIAMMLCVFLVACDVMYRRQLNDSVVPAIELRE